MDIVALTLQEHQEAVQGEQMAHISAFAGQKLVDALFLGRLLECVASEGEVVILEDYSRRVVDKVAMAILLQQALDVTSAQKRVEECLPFAHLHERMCADTALEELLAELDVQLAEHLTALDREQAKGAQSHAPAAARGQQALGGALAPPAAQSRQMVSQLQMDLRHWLLSGESCTLKLE